MPIRSWIIMLLTGLGLYFIVEATRETPWGLAVHGGAYLFLALVYGRLTGIPWFRRIFK